MLVTHDMALSSALRTAHWRWSGGGLMRWAPPTTWPSATCG